MTPFFSILMPTYNSAAFVAKAVDSVMRQTYSNWELVISDDCSSDETVEIVESLANSDQRIRILKRKSNSGGALQPRLDAFRSSKGEFVVELDSDDFIEDDFLERLYRVIRDEDADAVLCRLQYDGVKQLRFLPNDNFDYSLKGKGRDLVALTLDGWSISCNGCFRRDLYERSIQRLGKLSANHDNDEYFSRLLLIESRTTAFCRATYHYVVRNESVTKNLSVGQFRTLSTSLSLVDMIREEFGFESHEFKLANSQLFHQLWWLTKCFVTLDSVFVKEYGSEIVALFRIALKGIRFYDLRTTSDRLKLTMLKISIPATFKLLFLYGRIKNK